MPEETVTLRNDGGRVTGGPAEIRVERGETVTVPAEAAATYLADSTNGLVVIEESESDEPAAGADEPAETHDVDAMDYRELQDLASRYDGVKGNQSEEDLREDLREKA